MFNEKEYLKKKNPTFIIINNHNKILTTYDDSVNYLKNHKELNRDMGHYLYAYHEIADLIPQTTENIGSGHFFPFLESGYELENSYELCLEGFYSYSFAALRSVLELCIIGIFFAVDNKEHENVRPWISSKKQTPRFKDALQGLNKIPCFKEFNQRFVYIKKTIDLYHHLSGYIHTRGFQYSSTASTKANFNQFNEKALIKYSKLMFSVVSSIIEIMLIKYPIGIKPLPLFDKFGINPPAGGFLEFQQIIYLKYVLTDEKLGFIEHVADNDQEVKDIINELESLPDLSSEELHKQAKEFDKFLKKDH